MFGNAKRISDSVVRFRHSTWVKLDGRKSVLTERNGGGLVSLSSGQDVALPGLRLDGREWYSQSLQGRKDHSEAETVRERSDRSFPWKGLRMLDGDRLDRERRLQTDEDFDQFGQVDLVPLAELMNRHENRSGELELVEAEYRDRSSQAWVDADDDPFFLVGHIKSPFRLR